jgi:hypothetical protein
MDAPPTPTGHPSGRSTSRRHQRRRPCHSFLGTYIARCGERHVEHTYEDTETIQRLIVGRDITGVGAFN